SEKKKYGHRASHEIQVGLRAVKGPTFGIHGLSSGVCTAEDLRLWKNPKFTLLAITDEYHSQVVGYLHVVQTTIAGKKYLTLPGINPSAEFIGKVDGEKLRGAHGSG